MKQKNIEIILFRQLAYYLNFPVVIIDAAGNFIFCNESAEKILKFKFSETGEMKVSEWITILAPQDEKANLIKKENLPLLIAQNEKRISYDKFYIRNVQNETKLIEVFAFPIIDQMNKTLGAIAFFQELKP